MLVGGHETVQRRVSASGGVEVDFAVARGEVGEETEQARFGHRAGPGKAEDGGWGVQAGATGLVTQEGGPAGEEFAAEADGFAAGSHDGGGFGRDADGGEAEVSANADEQAADGGVQMHVFVGIGMAEGQAGGGEGGELGADFGGELAAHDGAKEVIQAEAELIGREVAGGAQQIRDFGGGQDGRPFDHHQMQADAQIWQAAGAADRILCRFAGDHEAGGIEHAIAMGALNAFVDGFGEAEIVRRES